ncbi:hypothetical protein CPT06_11170 [Bacillus vallismortis]|uniref:hypothetical protein n=1 Tax=Bacillus vallismortis TaxID=72361 RepID=UPI000C29A165|nr:hypothetical protein [Bacillus vallismortis]PJZ00378.1 hypothetical protein CPT06_11170 [Bacillus vallismortis]
MPYITPEYYNNVYKGAAAPDSADLERYIERASDIIDQITNFGLYGKGIDSLPAFFRDSIMKATAAQVEFYVMKGGDAAVNAGTDDMNSVSVGSFSYSTGGGSSSNAGSGTQSARLSPSALSFLAPTGLLYRGVSVRG